MSITWNEVFALVEVLGIPAEKNGEFKLVNNVEGNPLYIKYVDDNDPLGPVKLLHEVAHGFLLLWRLCPTYRIKEVLHRQVKNRLSPEDLNPAQQEFYYRQIMTMEIWTWLLTFDIIKYVLDKEVSDEIRDLAYQCADSYALEGGLSPHWLNPISDWDKTDCYWMTW